MALDEPVETDLVREVNGVNIAIENQVIDNVSAVTLDYQETEEGPKLILLKDELDNC